MLPARGSPSRRFGVGCADNQTACDPKTEPGTRAGNLSQKAESFVPRSFPQDLTRLGERLITFIDGSLLTVGTVDLLRPSNPISSERLTRAASEGLNMSVAAWASHLPEVHPFLLDTARLIDRTVARFELRISALQAELARGRAAFAARRSLSETTAESARLTAYQEAIADYQATVSECRRQFEAHVASRWSAAEIAQAKRRVGAVASSSESTT